MPFWQDLRKVRAVGIGEAIKKAASRLLYGRAFSFFEAVGLHVLPVHYYSPVPDTRELRHTLAQWYREWSFDGVEFDPAGQLELLVALGAFAEESTTLPRYEDVLAKGYGEGYSPVDARILHAMIRLFKPRTILEVGCGVSTFYSAHALARNREETDVGATLVCVDPYLRPALEPLERVCAIEWIPRRIQDLDRGYFERLAHADMLFIDSSHTVRINSDVNYLYLEVLPKLSTGVLVAIHDIPFPYPTLEPGYWIFAKHLFWTEPALLHAFLMYNSAFRIRLCASYLRHKHPQALADAVPVSTREHPYPSALWLLKTLD